MVDHDESLSSEVARRFLEKRRSGVRVSIDAVLDSFPNIVDRTTTRAEVLKTITMSARETLGVSRSPGGAATDAHEELPQLEGYDIIDLIGRGGMGRVYEAYQQSTGRRVAVKFLLESTSASEDARHRFEREVELVARLEHPNIVSVLDSGILKGRYYYVMEHVEGKSLDAALSPGECDVRQAMRAMQRICETVDYAHQRGVLHRDLKPSNIMVDQRDEAHVLDFGLAKALDAGGSVEMTLSAPGQLLGTLAYMSPEQAQGDLQHLSVRSDVYSLGAIIYELLTGTAPYDITGPLSTTLRNIVEQTPREPSTIRHRLDRDAGAIALKALEKSPNDRYATAAELAADIGRFLANQTILARRPSLSTRAARWVKRNRAVATVGGASLVVILAMTVASFVRIMEQRDRALELVAALDKETDSTNPDTAEAQDAAMNPVLDSLARQFETTLADLPDEQIQSRNKLGEAYLRRAEYQKAEAQFRMALKQATDLHGSEHAVVAECLHNIGSALYFQGRYAEAQESYERALDMRKNLLGDRHERVVETEFYLATVYTKRGFREKADPLYHDVLEYRIERYGESSAEVAHARNNLGWFLLSGETRYAEAEVHFRSALQIFQSLADEEKEPEREAFTMHNLGDCLLKQQKYDEAEAFLGKALDMKDRRRGPDSLTAATTLHTLAKLKFETGKLSEAAEYCKRAIHIRAAHPEKADNNFLGSRRLLQRIQSALSGQDQ